MLCEGDARSSGGGLRTPPKRAPQTPPAAQPKPALLTLAAKAKGSSTCLFSFFVFLFCFTSGVSYILRDFQFHIAGTAAGAAGKGQHLEAGGWSCDRCGGHLDIIYDT